MLNIPCKVVYCAISLLYAASSLGLDKTALGAAVAIAYIVLALARGH